MGVSLLGAVNCKIDGDANQDSKKGNPGTSLNSASAGHTVQCAHRDVQPHQENDAQRQIGHIYLFTSPTLMQNEVFLFFECCIGRGEPHVGLPGPGKLLGRVAVVTRRMTSFSLAAPGGASGLGL